MGVGQNDRRPGSRVRYGVVLEDAGESDEVVGLLGGSPALPDSTAWPRCEGGRPLGFVMALDCALLNGPGTGFPEEGTLLFFHHESDAFPCIPGPCHHVQWVPDDVKATARSAPPDAKVQESVSPLRARRVPALRRGDLSWPQRQGWRMLVQVTNDDKNDTFWTDGRMLYWLIRQRDLVLGFEETGRPAQYRSRHAMAGEHS